MCSTRSVIALVFLAGLVVASARAAGPAGKVAYARGGWLNTQDITAAGAMRPGARSRRVCRLPRGQDLMALAWSADGRQVAFSGWKEGGNGNPEGEYALYAVEDRPDAKPRYVAAGGDPAFAPQGRRLTYTRGASRWEQDVEICDLDTSRKRVLRKKALCPSWSADGRLLALVDESRNDFNVDVLVVDAATGQRVVFRAESINVSTVLLSPDGRYAAWNPHLSRPKLQARIADRRTGKTASVPEVGEPVLDWSHDSRWLLWTRWIVDPQNDGAFLRLEVWASDAQGRNTRRIGDGCAARFAPDGRHVLRVGVRSRRFDAPGDLVVTDLRGRGRRRLARRVTPVIAVWRKR